MNDSAYAYVLGGQAAAKKDNQNCSNFVDNKNESKKVPPPSPSPPPLCEACLSLEHANNEL